MRIFKSGLVLVFGIMFSFNVFAGGDYDGVWMLNSGTEADLDYYVVYQNGNTLLLISNYAAIDGWEAWTGQLSAPNVATVSNLINADNVSTTVTINFSSLTTGTITLDSCTPASECDIQVGVPISVTKIF